MILFLKLFILVKRSTCFGGLSVHHQELKTAHTATDKCQTAAAIQDEMELLSISSPTTAGGSSCLT